MDSVTHLVLGAAIGEVTLGKKLGYKAAIIGAIADTIPDFDVFGNFFTNDEILKLQIHRSYSHALFDNLLLAIPLAWLTYILFKKQIPYRRWYLLWMLGLVSHIVLDCCTTYGTQFFLPFSHMLVGFNNISVVDIFFTLPFMVFVIVCQFIRKENPMRVKIAWAGIGYALLYLCFTLVNKYNVQRHFEAELERQNIHADVLYTSPTFFNNFLWAGIAETDDSIWLGEYSILQGRKDVKWVSYARNISIVNNYPDKHGVEILKWFSQGKYFAQQSGDTLKFFNAKWGRNDFREKEAAKAFGFYYELFPLGNGWQAEVKHPKFTGKELRAALHSLWRRIFHAEQW